MAGKRFSMIPFNKPYLSGREVQYMSDAVTTGKISGNGKYTKLCQDFFERRYHFHKCLLTTSCTDALEMAAILLDIKPGDEVIIPSFTFVSTANAFVLRGATIVFADSRSDQPCLDESTLEELITARTKAIVVVHYAGVACDMDRVMALATRNNLFVVEDAAQAIDSYYKGRPLGGIGHLAAFSFHETKNVISGEGGMLVVNDQQFAKRAEIIWEKGTNRSAFWRGEVDKYGWVDIGSSFLPSEIIAAFLYAQLENLEAIQRKRKQIWNAYSSSLQFLEQSGKIGLPVCPEWAFNNAHMFYLICGNEKERDQLIQYLKSHNVCAVFHYLSLHKSPYFLSRHETRVLKNTDLFSDCLVRLPFYFELSDDDQQSVIEAISDFYNNP